ncbi:MAG TPA: glycoside hydrolase family 15 protein, partial [Candidatus Dormibacteraeota bacterium]|nr:glycoside hydrolase family 15 protein [Candidatus Dormibacteraeota bacterium]
ALVSRAGSIDWCCMPRFDSGSVFGRLLDWDNGGYCAIEPQGEIESVSREYLGHTLVLVTRYHAEGGVLTVTDCMEMRMGAGAGDPHRHIMRVLEVERGSVDVRLRVCPRFDYGDLRPWIRHEGRQVYSAMGGDEALVVSGDFDLHEGDDHDICAEATVRPGDRMRLSVVFARPEQLDHEQPEQTDPHEFDRKLDGTIKWWRDWAKGIRIEGADAEGALRSAGVLMALSHAPTGAIVAAPTTSLPEAPEGKRNWDYRFSWIRDASLTVRAMADLGFEDEADRFRRFMLRTAAGSVEDLQVFYGVGGERRVAQQELGLEGYRGAQPVRAGNDASRQLQLDAFGELVTLTWRWHMRGNSPGDDDWRFTHDLVDTAVERWKEPDAGIWEWQGEPQHFVHSKVLCWAAVDRGLKLAKDCMRKAPEQRWRTARDEIRQAVESKGYDKKRGVFVQAFGSDELDAALLLLPTAGFIDWNDERMVRTADAIRDELDDDGLLRRYKTPDGLGGREGAFVACSFWLAECLANQQRLDEAREVFDRAVACGNGLGLFSEEWDTRSGEMLGNFPQGLTHLSHIAATVALTENAPASAE